MALMDFWIKTYAGDGVVRVENTVLYFILFFSPFAAGCNSAFMICSGPEAGGNRLGAIRIKMKCPFLFRLHRAGDTKTASLYKTHTVMADIFTAPQTFAFHRHVLHTQRCVCTEKTKRWAADEVPQMRSLMEATKDDKLRWLNVWIYVEHMLESGGLVVLASAAASFSGYICDNIKNNKLFHFEEFESHFDSL